jgi:hypothetical protein
MMCVCEGELGKFKECDEFYLNDNDLCGVIPPQVQALSSQPSMSFYEIYNNPGLGTPCVWEPSFVPTMSFAPTHAPTAKKQSSGSGNSFFTSAGFLVGSFLGIATFIILLLVCYRVLPIILGYFGYVRVVVDLEEQGADNNGINAGLHDDNNADKYHFMGDNNEEG